VKQDKVTHADAIVFLMGSYADRILQTVDLYNQNVADQIFIVEGETNATLKLKEMGFNMISAREQICNALIFLGIPSNDIKIISGNALSTKDEAIIIRNYIYDNSEIDTLVLVTSSTHSRRAALIFNRAFDKSKHNMTIKCSPNYYSDFDPGRWWKNKDDIEIVMVDYLKLFNFFLVERWQFN
jgi:uncharacterized SAM-binding protein YcdF (DUF218 family)